jgi:hypothetical protein
MSRYVTRLLLPAVLVSLFTTTPLPAQQSPPGYQLLTAPQSSGGLLLAQRQGVASATHLLLSGFREVATFFDTRPQAVGGFRDTRDQYAEAGFQAAIRRVPVSGVTFAVTAGGTATVGFAFDTPTTLPQSLPRLFALVGLQAQTGPSNCPPPGASWHAAPYPDGSGQMVLPAGWRITSANQGMATAEGPHGAVNAARWVPVITRAGAAQKLASQRQLSGYLGVPLPQSEMLVGDPTNPASALVDVYAGLSAASRQVGLPPFRLLRVIQARPAPVQGFGLAQAGLVHLELDEGGVLKQGLAYVILGTVDADGQWLYFETSLSAEAACFAQNVPTLVRIATSAQTANHVLQARLDHAAQVAREIEDMVYSGHQNSSRIHDRMDEKYREQHVGTRVIEDVATGTRTTVDLAQSADIVRRLNQQYGPDRYREIPAGSLNQ